MDRGNVFVDSEVVYPILFIPKKCTPLETNCEKSDNIYIDLTITSPDSEGNEIRIYSGFCNVKLVDSYDFNQNFLEPPKRYGSLSSIDGNDIDQMPIILSEANQLSFPSTVWIDPSTSPYVYNHYDPTTKERYSFRESQGCITVQQHNTYITQNVYNYNENNVINYTEPQQSPMTNFGHKKFRKPEAANQPDLNMNFYDEEEYECGVFLSQLQEEILNEKQSRAQEAQKLNDLQSENSALKQLMSPDIQSVSKQRKTILFLGNDLQSGQTIQNISYNDPMVKCTGPEVDNEVVIEDSSPAHPKRKKYQCDKCKQIFHQISAFRQHMVGNHTNYNVRQPEREVSFMCSQCGKSLKDQVKFETHCRGHGDPDLECFKCHKVYASKFTLRAHQKIHERNFHCNYCAKTYDSDEDLQVHLEKVHSTFLCQSDDCTYITNKHSELRKHQDNHNKENEGHVDSILDDIINKEYDEIAVEVELKSEEFEGLEGTDEVTDTDRIREADCVIAKVMANKIFLLNSKMAKKHGRYHKTCNLCHKTFDRISDLKRHLIEHVIRSTLDKSPVSKNGTLNIICEVCQNESFTKIDKYKAHLREHAKLTLYKCTFCDKSFSDSSNFSKHKKIHGVSYFQCDLCQRKFNSKKMISQHMEYHMKNKPIKCRLCPKIFHFQSMLNKHVKCAHNKEERTKFRCRFCDDVFRTLKEKWDHEWMVHNVRKMIVDCLICETKFRKYSELKRHCLDEHSMDIPPAKRLLKKKTCFKKMYQ